MSSYSNLSFKAIETPSIKIYEYISFFIMVSYFPCHLSWKIDFLLIILAFSLLITRHRLLLFVVSGYLVKSFYTLSGKYWALAIKLESLVVVDWNYIVRLINFFLYLHLITSHLVLSFSGSILGISDKIRMLNGSWLWNIILSGYWIFTM